MSPVKKRNNLFIERSLMSVLDFFKEAVFSEETARKSGLLQSIGPKTKIILLVVFLLAACLTNNIAVLTALYILSLLLAVLSGINIFFFIKRVWVFIPIFAAVIAIPAFFIQGWLPASIFVIRVATCVSFTVLITITTRHIHIFRSLRSFGIPDIFVQVLDMTYRYAFVFIKVFEEMHLSLKARLVRSMGGGQARHWVASRISFLFKRSARMSEEVYLAMLARGYTGEKYGK